MSKGIQESQPRLFNIPGAANYLGVSDRTIERYVEEGLLKTVRLPHPTAPQEFLQRTLIEKVALDALAEAGIRI